MRRPAESVPHDQPGRGLTMAAEHFLFAAPQLDQIATINARHPGVTAPQVRLLPTELAPADVAPLYRGAGAGGNRATRGRPGRRSRSTLAENPLLLVLGDTKSGKTTLLRHLIRTVRENSTPDQVAFTVLDRRLHLVEEPLFPDNEYTANIDRVIPAMLGLSAIIEGRRPPAGVAAAELANWSYRSSAGHTHYLIIDDVDQIPDSPMVSGPYAANVRGHR